MFRAVSLAAEIFRQPLTWAIAFIFSASEAPSLYSAASAGSAVGEGGSVDLLAQVVTALLCCMAFALAEKARRALEHPAPCLALGLVGMAALPFAWGYGAGGAGIIGWAALVCAQLSFMGLTLALLLQLMRQPPLAVRRIAVASAVINAALVAVMECAPLGLSGLCMAAGSGVLAVVCAGSSDEAVASYRSRALRAPCALVLGFFAIAASFGFLQSLLYQQSQETVVVVVASTKLFAALLFSVVLFWHNDTGYATLAKLVITLAAGSFLVFLARGSYSPLASAFMATGYSLLEVTALVLLADLASYARCQPLRLFSAFYLVETLGYAAGCGLLDGVAAFDPSLLRVVAAGLALMLLVCAVWVFTENRVNAFTWGTQGGKPGEALPPRGGLPREGALPLGGGLAREGAVDALSALSLKPESGTHDLPRVAGDASVLRSSLPSDLGGEVGLAGKGEIGGGETLPDGEGGAVGRGSPAEDTGRPFRSLTFAEQVALVVRRYRLTEREAEVLELFAAGRSATFIAELKFVTANTVRSHIKHLYAKCDVHSRQELISLIESMSEEVPEK